MKQKNKLVQINTVCNTSTGHIMHDIQEMAEKCGYETLSIVGRRKVYSDLPCIKMGDPISFWTHVAITTVFDKHGFGSYFETKKIIRALREFKPDIIHLHNVHGYYLYLPLLFEYLKKEFAGKIFWTFHDCWPFTGHCAYYTMAECKKWKHECCKCFNKCKYPTSLFLDGSRNNYYTKRDLFTNIPNLKILVPSKWLYNQTKQSFMGEYEIEITPNGIDLDKFCFHPNPLVTEKYGFSEEKTVILSVANVWDERKGLADLLLLSRIIPEEYQMVVVGLSKRQIKHLPGNIVGIERTENTEELVNIYSEADVFLNPSKEETFSMVTLEAIGCGTPAVVLDTSAVGELICEDNGIVLCNNSPQDYLEAIRKLTKHNLTREQVAGTALKYSKDRTTKNIVAIYGGTTR